MKAKSKYGTELDGVAADGNIVTASDSATAAVGFGELRYLRQ